MSEEAPTCPWSWANAVTLTTDISETYKDQLDVMLGNFIRPYSLEDAYHLGSLYAYIYPTFLTCDCTECHEARIWFMCSDAFRDGVIEEQEIIKRYLARDAVRARLKIARKAYWARRKNRRYRGVGNRRL